MLSKSRAIESSLNFDGSLAEMLKILAHSVIRWRNYFHAMQPKFW
jgi:hypothetical protein